MRQAGLTLFLSLFDKCLSEGLYPVQVAVSLFDLILAGWPKVPVCPLSEKLPADNEV